MPSSIATDTSSVHLKGMADLLQNHESLPTQTELRGVTTMSPSHRSYKTMQETNVQCASRRCRGQQTKLEQKRRGSAGTSAVAR